MNTWYKIQHPEVFQGTLNEKNYFEGWYFKISKRIQFTSG
jgi:hypothetical protein